MFGTVGIIGFGLIGSSIAHNLRDRGLCDKIVCLDKDKDVCDYVLNNRLADQASDNPENIAECDLVILSVPVRAIAPVMESIQPYLRSNTIVTDVGSVKQNVIESVLQYLPPDVEYVPGHPMAGTEFSGPAAGFLELFEGKKWLLTPLENTSLDSLSKIQGLCESMGSDVYILPADKHDTIVGMTSHLPQLISYIVMNTAEDLETDINHDVIPYSANGFHGFARIAASDPIMWRDIYLTNQGNILNIIDRFETQLARMKQAIQNRDDKDLYDYFAKSKSCRENYLKKQKS
jgi:cyclohexadieny/prephenate dehydrogenase